MDLIPPSYQSATDRDAWAIIAHYIPSSDLCAASLVCRRWHDLFMPFLWGDPASHFGTENDAVYGRFPCGALYLTSNPALTEDYSGSHALPQNTQICQTRGQGVDTYTSSSACPIGDLRWSTARLAEGDPGSTALSAIVDGLEVAVL